ncbi:MAG: hypothetical protein JRF65_15670, partial [Deltaproteobacteria bacterium]|nr:hypothetical protein [Deltaproteobacteria bacterium]
MFYLIKTFWPADLSLFYPYYTHVAAWKIGGAALLLTGISVLSILWARKRPYFIMGWAWYLVTLLPVIGVTESGPIRVADRYTYLPLVGIFIMIAWGLAEVLA